MFSLPPQAHPPFRLYGKTAPALIVGQRDVGCNKPPPAADKFRTAQGRNRKSAHPPVLCRDPHLRSAVGPHIRTPCGYSYLPHSLQPPVLQSPIYDGGQALRTAEYPGQAGECSPPFGGDITQRYDIMPQAELPVVSPSCLYLFPDAASGIKQFVFHIPCIFLYVCPRVLIFAREDASVSLWPGLSGEIESRQE